MVFYGCIIPTDAASVTEQIAKLLQKITGIIGVALEVYLAFVYFADSCYPDSSSKTCCVPGITRMDAFVIPMFPVQQHHTQTAIGRLAAIRDGDYPLWIDSLISVAVFSHASVRRSGVEVNR